MLGVIRGWLANLLRNNHDHGNSFNLKSSYKQADYQSHGEFNGWSIRLHCAHVSKKVKFDCFNCIDGMSEKDFDSVTHACPVSDQTCLRTLTLSPIGDFTNPLH